MATVSELVQAGSGAIPRTPTIAEMGAIFLCGLAGIAAATPKTRASCIGG